MSHNSPVYRSVLFAAIAAIAAATLAACITEGGDTADDTSVVKMGQTAPDFSVEMLDGSRRELADLRGRVVLLTFWSSECPMCREEMAQAREAVVDRIAGKDIVYLPVSRGESREQVEAFCRETGCTFPVGLDPDRSIYTLYATAFVPRTFVIDRNGICGSYAEYPVEKLGDIVGFAESLL